MYSSPSPRPESTLADLPYISFLSSYPHPAFILPTTRRPGQLVASLDPAFANAALRALLLGPDADTKDFDKVFLKSISSVHQARALSAWAERGLTRHDLAEELFTISVTPGWTPEDMEPVQLELTRTLCDEFLVITSVPRSPLPHYVPLIRPARGFGRPSRDFNMKLPDFPPPQALTLTTSAAASASTPLASSSVQPQLRTGASESHLTLRSPERIFELPSKRRGTMKDMIENFDWSKTSVGARETWPHSMRAVLSYLLNDPFPVRVTRSYASRSDPFYPHSALCGMEATLCSCIMMRIWKWLVRSIPEYSRSTEVCRGVKFGTKLGLSLRKFSTERLWLLVMVSMIS